MKKLSCLILSGAAVVASQCASQSSFAGNVGWSVSPSGMVEGHYESKLGSLPAKAALSAAHTPWTDTWWPSYKGGVAARWNWLPQNPLMASQTSPEYDQMKRTYSSAQLNSWFYYHLYTHAELMAMTPEARNAVMHAISPAEKLDIYNGKYITPGPNNTPTANFYPTVMAERKRVNTGDAWWEGICHGWATAALAYIEPAVREDLVNANGLQVPFGSSDVKALLASHSTEAGGQRKIDTLGNQCKKTRVLGIEFTRGCDATEVNAGAFHIVIANLIGLRQEGFVIERDPTTEVWNQPVYGYRSTFGQKVPAGRGKNASSAVYQVAVTTELDWTDDEKPNYQPLNGTAGFKFETAILKYVLELDGQDNIVGGRWISYEYGSDEDKRSFTGQGPDYLWKMSKYPFTGNYTSLKDIYKPSMAE